MENTIDKLFVSRIAYRVYSTNNHSIFTTHAFRNCFEKIDCSLKIRNRKVLMHLTI
jgi:hypothetical protein